VSHAAAAVGLGLCGPVSMCSGPGCGECRARCAAVDTLGTPCKRASRPSHYECLGAEQPGSSHSGTCPSASSAAAAAIAAAADDPPRVDFDGTGPLSARSVGGGDAGSSSSAQHLVKNFVRNIVKGVTVSLLSTSDGPAECIVSMDRGLKTMSLRRTDMDSMDVKRRSFLLEQISGIVIGDDALNDSGPAGVSELCVTLFLETGQAVALGFPDLEERDTFALCLAMFVGGRRVEADEYP